MTIQGTAVCNVTIQGTAVCNVTENGLYGCGAETKLHINIREMHRHKSYQRLPVRRQDERERVVPETEELTVRSSLLRRLPCRCRLYKPPKRWLPPSRPTNRTRRTLKTHGFVHAC